MYYALRMIGVTWAYGSYYVSSQRVACTNILRSHAHKHTKNERRKVECVFQSVAILVPVRITLLFEASAQILNVLLAAVAGCFFVA